MFTVVYRRKDYDKIKLAFGKKPIAELPWALEYRGKFQVDMLEDALSLGLVLYGYEKNWGFVCDGKYFALIETVANGNIPENPEDQEAVEYIKLLRKVKRKMGIRYL